MKLLRYGPKGQEKPALLDNNGRIRDLSDKLNDLSGSNLDPDRLSAFANLNTDTLPIVEGTVRLGPPVAGIGKIIAIGLNYADHAAETGMELPDEPVLFSKAITAINGPNDPVILPKGSTKVDWEVELAVIIGRKAQYVEQMEASSFIAGYAVFNDVSERAFQLEGSGQWVKGKSFDTSAPLGPWLVTPEDITNPQDLHIWLDVNGERFQDGNTRTMAFGIGHLVSYVSHYMTLMPGDVIATGTPPGVGLGFNPPIFLKPGDLMRLGIEGLGEQNQEVKEYKKTS
ncbi:MAG: 2-hydroxyhepta-2,4-diene-1,7-dioate isomerase [Rhodospirillaceae bacterium TMED8]|nr:2-hydroxyhepta-2,4-diene-1,7-dioate isomerase [Magnetovibrio sp.]OUT49620.1 MAG: 2-hydroxyhepta-2,4-diene-1,7-dioate isomerase [Rhodospirillaceae bacterium TMED8]|tara:strand:+ start:3831 stop:4685 length:855 start_codon:yes stop_codon:yes gene_type:complete